MLTSLVIVFSTSSHATSESNRVTVVTNEWFEYAFMKEGKVHGHAYVVADAVLKEAGISPTYMQLTWDRVYNIGREKPSVMILGIARTPERENDFYWIGPVTKEVDNYFYKRAESEISLQSLVQLKDYSIAVEKNSNNHEFLIKHELWARKLLAVSDANTLTSMLVKGRVDLILYNSDRVRIEEKMKRLEPGSIVPALKAFHRAQFLTFSLNTPKAVVAKVKRAYKSLAEKGEIILH